ncbi:hypothetical protein ACSFBX_34565 [Variovorax sp. RB2P76]|uniref:hypothetical protein n=1 Tax=Variovorax sp. RB2P76 TaxID=3443736 RepID=UPI003F4561BF
MIPDPPETGHVEPGIPGHAHRNTHNPSLLTLDMPYYCLELTLPTLLDGVKDTLAPSWKGGTLRRTN